MKILALEFSSPRRSVAVGDGSGRTSGACEQGDRGGQPFALIERALEQASVSREQIECVAVGLGPGSYAGIRSAIALAQGWQLARRVHLVGIPSVDCLAAQAQAAGIHGRVHFLIDAQRGEFYLGIYEIGATVQLLEPLRLLPGAEAPLLAARGPVAVGQDLATRFPGAHVLEPDAAALCALAGPRKDFVAGEQLQPIYLRETNFVKAPLPRKSP